MGDEIDTIHFTKSDFEEFHRRLAGETALLGRWFDGGRFEETEPIGGFEVEAWLVDRAGLPVPRNEEFLQHLDHPLVVPELARFNVELNAAAVRLRGDALSATQRGIEETWRRCGEVAGELGMEAMLVGILPSLRDSELTLENLSPMKRYRALNEQVFRLRRGKPITLDIEGREHLRAIHHDVMLEAAATSFQIHLQVSPAKAVRYYNASVILSAPMVAMSANSPFLFGRDLWDETRIPLFEQAVRLAPLDGPEPNRVTLGTDYARASLHEFFAENLASYPVLLPTLMDEPPERLAHVRLLNGTIWRWNRPLIGFNEQGVPHVRIEHRVMPAGPSIADMIANAALYFGLAEMLANAPAAPEAALPFAQAQANLYAAARDGLGAQIAWLDGRTVAMRELLLRELLPLARRGLEKLEFDREDIARYLGIIESRVASGQNGAAWQRAHVARHGADMQALTCAYREHQRSGAPVHEWT
ncbi:MAG: glutamate--cysteine ligase [Chthoniobacteraceae bacterium]